MVSSVSNPGSGHTSRPGADRTGNTTSRREPAAAPASQAGQPSIRTPEDAMNVLRARLEQRLGQGLGNASSGTASSPLSEFKPPSAADVASRVLGFVQNRLQQEADSGADPDRLADLLDQARKGVNQGFSEAREQIEALGMMNGDLSADIDDSFNRIQKGLDDLGTRYLGDVDDSQSVSNASATRVEASSRDQLAFEIRTRDGDVVTVTMDEQRYAGASRASVSSEQGSASQETAVSLFAGRYQFSIEGELDGGEKQALAALFEDVQDVAGRFFDGDVQTAFKSAQALDLDGAELASFSLNLSSVRTVSASTYESVSQQPSISSQLRPLAGLARDIQSLGQQAVENGLDSGSLGQLMDQVMADLQSRASDRPEYEGGDLMNDFWQAVLGELEPNEDEAG